MSKDFAGRFNDLLNARGVVPAKGRGRYTAVASMFGVSPETARRWCAGIALPSHTVILKAAKYLGVSPSWLEYGVTDNQADFEYFPLLTWDEAKNWKEAIADADPGRKRFTCPVPHSSDHFLLTVNSDSMRPALKPGQILWIEPQYKNLRNRNLLILLRNGVTSLARLYTGDGEMRVSHKDKENWGEMEPLSKYEIIGKVMVHTEIYED